MDFASDPNTWDAMMWDAAAKDIMANGPTGQAFGVVNKWAENQGMIGNKANDLTNLAESKKFSLQAPPAQPTPMENLKLLLSGKAFPGLQNPFKNPNKNPYPGRTALGGSAGEIFGNALEQR